MTLSKENPSKGSVRGQAGERRSDQLRAISIETGFSKYAEGSVLIKCGDTHVLCNASIEDYLPAWLKEKPEPQGWLTAEYALLPRSTHTRVRREQRWPKGRTLEISRLIGRSLRMAVNLKALGQRQLIIDCDVLQADGGTRTAAITGGWVAVNLALWPLVDRGIISPEVFRHQIVAISVGIVKGEPLLDLDYQEDVSAEVDLNVVMTAEGDLIEIQGTAEKEPFPKKDLNSLLELAGQGANEIASLQKLALERLVR